MQDKKNTCKTALWCAVKVMKLCGGGGLTTSNNKKIFNSDIKSSVEKKISL